MTGDYRPKESDTHRVAATQTASTMPDESSPGWVPDSGYAFHDHPVSQYTTEIVANDMQMLDRTGESQEGDQLPGRTQSQPKPQVQPASQTVPNENAWADFDDNEPF